MRRLPWKRPQLVVCDWPGEVPLPQAIADHCRRLRQQRIARQAMENRVATVGDRNWLIPAVSHFPPGTSKWNKIEHRLFSLMSKYWRGQPDESRSDRELDYRDHHQEP